MTKNKWPKPRVKLKNAIPDNHVSARVSSDLQVGFRFNHHSANPSAQMRIKWKAATAPVASPRFGFVNNSANINAIFS